jgi:hypothetical protein
MDGFIEMNERTFIHVKGWARNDYVGVTTFSRVLISQMAAILPKSVAVARYNSSHKS